MWYKDSFMSYILPLILTVSILKNSSLIWSNVLLHFDNCDAYMEYLNALDSQFFGSIENGDFAILRKFSEVDASKIKISPYADNIGRLVNNGRCKIYNRKKDKLLDAEFADCVETAVRHLCAILLWDIDSQKFRASGNAEVDKFFSTIKNINDGSMVVRSEWCKIIGDLNDPSVEYSENHVGVRYDLNTGFLNWLEIFRCLFGVDVSTKKLREVRNNILLDDTFTRVLTEISGGKSVVCTFKETKNQEESDDYYGVMRIKIDGHISLNIYASLGHGEIRRAKYLTPREYYPGVKCKLPEVYSLLNYAVSGISTDESTFYYFYGRKMCDNIAYINFVKSYNHPKKPKFYASSLINVLPEFNWSDNHFLEELSSTLIVMMLKGCYVEVLQKYVIGLYLLVHMAEESVLPQLANLIMKFTNLQYVSLREDQTGVKYDLGNLDLSRLEKLKTVIIENVRGITINSKNKKLVVLQLYNVVDSMIDLRELNLVDLCIVYSDTILYKDIDTTVLQFTCSDPPIDLTRFTKLERLETYSFTDTDVLRKALYEVKYTLKELIIPNYELKDTLEITDMPLLQKFWIDDLVASVKIFGCPAITSIDLGYVESVRVEISDCVNVSKFIVSVYSDSEILIKNCNFSCDFYVKNKKDIDLYFMNVNFNPGEGEFPQIRGNYKTITLDGCNDEILMSAKYEKLIIKNCRYLRLVDESCGRVMTIENCEELTFVQEVVGE